MPSEEEIQAAGKEMASQCYDLEQSSPMYKALGVHWEKIAKTALEAAEAVREEQNTALQEENVELKRLLKGLAYAYKCSCDSLGQPELYEDKLSWYVKAEAALTKARGE